ncbi:MAG: nucleoside recognition domain-containing protein [Ignavibacteriaceae bacterium]
MLNYVWLTLLFLGIVSATYLDISEFSSNKYNNNKPLEVVLNIEGRTSDESEMEAARIIISSAVFNSFYKTSISNEIEADMIISNTEKEGRRQFVITVTDKSPKVWRDVASISGSENELRGTILLTKTENENIYTARLFFEEISFVWLKKVTNDAIKIAQTAVEIALGLIGIMALWLGVMKVAEEAGLIKIIAGGLSPITRRLFPEVPSDHPAIGSMVMNISANMLGLGNAATPFGLKAMEELDKLNTNKGTATNSMVTFLAINTAGMTLIPATAIAVRAASGSANPAVIIGTSIFGAFCAVVVGLTAAKLFERFPIPKGQFTGWLKQNRKFFYIILSIFVVVAALILTGAGQFLGSLFGNSFADIFKSVIQVISIIAIPLLIFVFIGYGALKKVKVYEQFVEGAKEGFNIAVRIIPYLVAMLVAISIFRAGGAMDNWLIPLLRYITDPIGFPAEALPMALMRPLSGSGSLGIMAETMAVHGPDSFIGILVSTFFGSTETTFYVLAVYFGAVNIKNTRHALPAGLLADVAGILGALFIVKLLFG